VKIVQRSVPVLVPNFLPVPSVTRPNNTGRIAAAVATAQKRTSAEVLAAPTQDAPRSLLANNSSCDENSEDEEEEGDSQNEEDGEDFGEAEAQDDEAILLVANALTSDLPTTSDNEDI